MEDAKNRETVELSLDGPEPPRQRRRWGERDQFKVLKLRNRTRGSTTFTISCSQAMVDDLDRICAITDSDRSSFLRDLIRDAASKPISMYRMQEGIWASSHPEFVSMFATPIDQFTDNELTSASKKVKEKAVLSCIEMINPLLTRLRASGSIEVEYTTLYYSRKIRFLSQLLSKVAREFNDATVSSMLLGLESLPPAIADPFMVKLGLLPRDPES
jgi:hypothetical protein